MMQALHFQTEKARMLGWMIPVDVSESRMFTILYAIVFFSAYQIDVIIVIGDIIMFILGEMVFILHVAQFVVF